MEGRNFPGYLKGKGLAQFPGFRSFFRFMAAERFRPEPVQRAENGLGIRPFVQDEHPPVAGSGLDGADPFQLQEPAFNAAGLVMVEHAAAAAHPEPAGRMMDNLVMHG